MTFNNSPALRTARSRISQQRRFGFNVDPCRAIALAGKLIEAALPRLKGRMTP